VLWARDGKATQEERAYVALSTILALRREELVEHRLADVDFDKSRVFVHTCKGGDARWQLFPRDLIRLLDYPFVDYSATRMTGIFKRVTRKAGLNLPKGYGWHSIRRAVNNELQRAGLQQGYIHKFTRHRLPAIEDVYFTELDERVDAEVLKRHPVVALWLSESNIHYVFNVSHLPKGSLIEGPGRIGHHYVLHWRKLLTAYLTPFATL
jgi:integrase